jgi:hypothetical protein
MTYELFEASQGKFAIDWGICRQIVKSYYRSQLLGKYATDQTESQVSINPFSWGLPDLTYVTVDWDKLSDEAEARTTTELFLHAILLKGRGVDFLVRDLRRMQVATGQNNAAFKTRMQMASQKSLSDLQSSVAFYQSATDRSKVVRDLSGSILIGAATAATGGAAAAALAGTTLSTTGAVATVAGLGTIIKATATYQDTYEVTGDRGRSLGAATIEATQNIVFTVIPAGRGVALGRQQKIAKIVVSVVSDTSKALLSGQGLGTAMVMGAVNIPVPWIGDQYKSDLDAALANTAIPVATKILGGGVSKKVLEDRLKRVGQNEVRTLASGIGAIQASIGDGDSWSDVMSVADDWLLKLAIVDQSKGIGRSWW